MNNDVVITEISAIQVKLLFLHFKSLKINREIEQIKATSDSLNSIEERIVSNGDIAYSLIDIISSFESYNSLASNFFKYENMTKHLNSSVKRILGGIQKTTGPWMHVRNKIGGHIDIDPILEFCDAYNYKGVFISNKLKADFKGVLILQMIESAINITLHKSKLFDDKLILTDTSSLNKLITRINKDWKFCLDIFEPLSKFLYKIGKKDKLKKITSEDVGIIKF